MKLAVLGTGQVGRTLASKLLTLGHEVRIGAREANNQNATDWAEGAGAGASSGTFAEAAAFGEAVLNCTNGMSALEALEAAGAENLKGKVLLDVANPLDFSHGMPPTLSVCNEDSLGERIQRAFPEARVVKTLNTMGHAIMVDPRGLPESTQVFLSGNDAEAKNLVRGLLESMGWQSEEILDLGGITTARGTEMWLPLWLRIMSATGTAAFNLKIVPAAPE